jgi:type IV secretion system protein VirB9
MKRNALISLALLTLPHAALADGRIREVDYDDKQVVRLDGCFGFQTTIEFARGERIENVGIGDAAQWLVVPNKRADMLFVKPAYRVSHSNMTVSTDRRRYNFELSARDSAACKAGTVVYNLRFKYPAEPAPPPEVAVGLGELAKAEPAPPVEPPPEQRNAAYTFTGAKENIPVRVFDNGRATYFRWAEGTTTPAVYAIAADKTESLVSFSASGDYLVVPQVAPSFILRRGNAVAVLYNDAYQTPALDAASPQPRDVAEAAPRKGWSLFHRSAAR